MEIYKYKSWNDIPIEEQTAFKKISNWCWWKINKNDKNKLKVFLSKVKPPHWKFYKASCIAHDWGYTKGGNLKDKIKTDIWFFKYMLKDSARIKKLTSKIYFIILAFLYLFFVSIFWFFFFDFK